MPSRTRRSKYSTQFSSVPTSARYLHASLPPFGNLPQGSNRAYTLAFVRFAIFTLYMTVRYHDWGWYMSDLDDDEANFLRCSWQSKACRRCLKRTNLCGLITCTTLRKFVIQYASRCTQCNNYTVSYAISALTQPDGWCHLPFSCIRPWKTVRGCKTSNQFYIHN
jgi:hypothetical protein